MKDFFEDLVRLCLGYHLAGITTEEQYFETLQLILKGELQ